MSEADSIRCPVCAGAVETDYEAQGAPAATNPVLLGREQLMPEYGFKPTEVAKARQLFHGNGAECIRDDGKVLAPDSRSAGKFITHWHTKHAEKVAKEETTHK
jgi:hypothetical protein